MRPALAITLAVDIFVLSVVMTVASTLSRFDGASPDIRLEDFAAGRFSSLLTGQTLWSRYPSLPEPIILANGGAAIVTFVLAAMAFYVLRMRMRQPLGIVGTAMLPLAAAPSVAGAYALNILSFELAGVGTCMSLMVSSALYGSMLSAVLVLYEMIGTRVKISYAWMGLAAI